MSRFKDFGAGKSEGRKEPLSFKLHGEEFSCVPEVQGKILLDLVADAKDDDPAAAAQVIDKFFNAVLTDEAWERFDALLRHKEKIVSVDTLGEITSWLVEEYTNRPEGQPEVS
jgi:hypothetical protein